MTTRAAATSYDMDPLALLIAVVFACAAFIGWAYVIRRIGH